jgi:hypothetical protein
LLLVLTAPFPKASQSFPWNAIKGTPDVDARAVSLFRAA